jgi:hypothetical protein
VDAAGPRVLALGATKLDGPGVYADPAGHPFCLIPRPKWARRPSELTAATRVPGRHELGRAGRPGSRPGAAMRCAGAGYQARSGYNSPVEPSSLSRSRSACPLWRAYSSIMWVSTQRRDT